MTITDDKKKEMSEQNIGYQIVVNEFVRDTIKLIELMEGNKKKESNE